MWLLVAIRAEGRPGFSNGGPAPSFFSAMWPSVRALVHERRACTATTRKIAKRRTKGDRGREDETMSPIWNGRRRRPDR
jgi:hypothetical protein